MRNAINRIIPLLLAALIAAAGFIVPQKLLNRREKRIKEDEGAVDANDISVLSYESDDPADRLLQLSELAYDFFSGGVSDADIREREPIGTEMSYYEAVDSATVFSEAIMSEMESYGMPVYDGTFAYYSYADSGAKASTPDSSDTDPYAGFDVAAATFYSLTEDPSVSFWIVDLSGFIIVLDGASGTPVYVSVPVYIDFVWEMTGEDIWVFCEYISISVCDAYNEMYSLSFPTSYNSTEIGTTADGVMYWTYNYRSEDGCELVSTTTAETIFDVGGVYRDVFRLTVTG